MGAQVTTYGDVRQTARTALATMIAIPLVPYYLYFSVAFNDGGLLPAPTLIGKPSSRRWCPRSRPRSSRSRLLSLGCPDDRPACPTDGRLIATGPDWPMRLEGSVI
jgi:hypothetical protein